MIFKQGILKEEAIKLGVVMASVTIPLVVIIVFNLVIQSDAKSLVTFLLICFLPIYLAIALLEINNLEWYYIYDNRIEARCIFGIKNTVYYNKLISVEKVKINLTARGIEKTFYIFNDGRKNNNNIFNVNSCYNSQRYNLRIYKTAGLENYIRNSLKLTV